MYKKSLLPEKKPGKNALRVQPEERNKSPEAPTSPRPKAAPHDSFIHSINQAVITSLSVAVAAVAVAAVAADVSYPSPKPRGQQGDLR